MTEPSVVIVGGGFAGVGCARELAKHGVPVTLIDRNNYHQFQPLLYQVATGELGMPDVARPLRAVFKKSPSVRFHRAEVSEVDPATRTVTAADGRTFTGDYLVLAAGSRPNFFRTPGASEHAFPLYTVEHAAALRTRLLQIVEDVDADPRLVEQGALNFVIVGAGPTGVETAGALADARQPGHPQAPPRPRRQPSPDLRRGPRPGRARGVLRQGPHLRRRQTAARRRAAQAQHRGHGDRTGQGEAERRHGDPDPHRRLGRRDPSARAGGHTGSRPGPRGTGDGPVRPHRRRCPRRLRDRRHGQRARPRRRTTSLSSVRSPCRPAAGRPRTSWPTSRASRASPSTTRTRASWR